MTDGHEKERSSRRRFIPWDEWHAAWAARPWWKRKRTYALALLAGLVLWFAGSRAAMLAEQFPEQELCKFGTGSTELYKSLRAEAEAYLSRDGKARLTGYSSEGTRNFSTVLRRQLREFAMSRSTPTERWAALHALMRAYGMEFDGNGPRDPEKLKPEGVHTGAIYIARLPKYNWFCILCYVFPEGLIRFKVTNRGDGVYNQIGVTLDVTQINIKISNIYYTRAFENCPQVLK